MSPSTRPPTKLAQTTARIRMGAAPVNLSEVHERISIRATTATASAGPSNRRAYSLWSRLRRAGVAAFGPAAWACALPGLLAGLTEYRAYREAALASRPPHPGETADGVPYPPVPGKGNPRDKFRGSGRGWSN